MLTLRKNRELKDGLPPELQKKEELLSLLLKENEETNHYSVTVSSTDKKDYFWITGGLKEWAILIEDDGIKIPRIALVYIVSSDRIILLRHDPIIINPNGLNNNTTLLKLLKYHKFLMDCMSQYSIKYNVGDLIKMDARERRLYSEISQIPISTYFYDELMSGVLARNRENWVYA